MTNHVTIVGSLNVDTTMKVKRMPLPGETIAALSKTNAAGGKGANQAVAAARSGAETAFVGQVGDDAGGKMMINDLNDNNVDTTGIHVDDQAGTGSAAILLDESGQNSILVYGGANQQLSVKEVEDARDQIAAADFVIAQFETPIEATIEAFKIAKKKGAITILNPAPAIEKIPAELLKHTDLITPNETESAKITGIEIKSDADLVANAQKLHDLGVKNVVITYGDKGAYISSPDIQKLVSPFKVDAIDTTGAGDTFIGFLAGNLKKDLSNLEEAAKIASRASSIAVQRLGAQPSIPTAKEVQDLMEN